MLEIIIFSIIIITIWTVFVTVFLESLLCFHAKIDEGKCSAVTPKVLHSITNMNKFGCWCTAIFIRLINPVWSIVYFVYYIFHIGTEEKKQ